MKTSFDSLGLSPTLVAVTSQLGYAAATPIQAKGIPVLLAGRDLIAQSMTGSGKTAAFALPILHQLEAAGDDGVLRALVVCPTRELCAQVAREFRRLATGLSGLTVLELTGGQPSRPQIDALGRGVHVAVGTPGRLLDHLERGSLDPSTIQTLVLDEADRMLDMGFGEDVKRIVRALPGKRQTALFSATFPAEIESMSNSVLKSPERVTIEDPVADEHDIRQLQLPAAPEERFDALAWVLAEFNQGSALVFCNFKATVADVASSLVAAGVSADRLDGDLDQFHRDQVLARFRNGSVRVLVATDVAGRGIDVDGLDLVVNFELPNQPEAYVHRIGRTGRAGKSGLAVALTSGLYDERIGAIEELTGKTVEPIARESSDRRSLRDLLAKIAGAPRMETVLISGGRKDKVRPGDILGALTGDAGGLDGADVGKIEIHDRLSYVAVAEAVSRRAVARLNQGKIKGKRYRATLVGTGGAKNLPT